MNYQELNEYIKNYLENDKSKSAIMLNGPWGIGKSYYINECLIKYLSEDEKNKYSCIVISLHGVTSIGEINKLIFFERAIDKGFIFTNKTKNKKFKNIILKVKKLFQKNSSKIKFVGKTIVNSFLSSKNISIDISSNDIEQLFLSSDFKNILIVFEDLERASIDIIELLGYINTLVEQDRVKVLVVANENELIKYKNNYIDKEDIYSSEFKDKKAEYEEQLSELYDPKTITYLKNKEKSISDTINFECDYEGAINGIIQSFENETLNVFTDEKSILFFKKVVSSESQNLRSFLYACQKVSEIFNKCDEQNLVLHKETQEYIFNSLVVYAIKEKNAHVKVKSNSYIDIANDYLQIYPLLPPCRNYVENHYISNEELENLNEICNEFLKNNAMQDCDFSNIFNFYEIEESKLIESLVSIITKLEKNRIPIADYGRLAFCLFEISAVLDYDISQHKKIILRNLSETEEQITKDLLFRHHLSLQIDSKSQYLTFTKDMMQALNTSTKKSLIFNYSLEDDVSKNFSDIQDNKQFYRNNKSFARFFDNEKIVDFITQLIPRQLSKLRSLFSEFYARNEFERYYKEDYSQIEDLLDKLKNIESNKIKDKISALQINYLIEDLESYLSQVDITIQ